MGSVGAGSNKSAQGRAACSSRGPGVVAHLVSRDTVRKDCHLREDEVKHLVVAERDREVSIDIAREKKRASL